MNLRLKQSHYAQQSAPAVDSGIDNNTTDRSIAVLQQAFIIFTIGAILLLALMFALPDVATQIKNNVLGEAEAPVASAANPADPALDAPELATILTPATPASAHPVAAAETAGRSASHQQKWVTSWLSRRYRVATDATDLLVSTAYATADDIKLDPLLILAVMAIESGLNPFAESPVGAKGLMQVMAKVHRERFQELGGAQAVLNPVANIKVGSAILKEYVERGGSVEAGLKSYVGAAGFEHDDGYGSRVLTEYRHLKEVSNGKKVPITFPNMAKRAAPAAVSQPAKHVEPVAPETKGEQVATL